MLLDAVRLERELRTYWPEGGGVIPAGSVWPRYDGLCVGNFAATIAHMLGVDLPEALPAFQPGLLDVLGVDVRRVVLIVVDALGWLQVQPVMSRHRNTIFETLGLAGCLLPITTTFLSTTNSVLSTIWTGRPPRQHGLLAYEMFLREWLMAVESIGFSSPHEPFAGTLTRWGFKPDAFLPVPSVAQLLAVQGIPSYGVIYKGFTTTPLSLMHFRGAAEIRPHLTASDFWLELRRVLQLHRTERCLITGYWSAVDSLAHTFGPNDESGEVEIMALSSLMRDIFLDRLTQEDRNGTLLLLTADHGQITTPRASLIPLTEHPLLLDRLLLPPLGEGRVPFFHVRHGHYDAVWAYLNEHFSDRFLFLSQEDLIVSGLLGPGPDHPELAHRLGDIVGISIGDAAFVRDANALDRMVGRHGALTPEEMLVPLLAARLDS